MSHVWEQPVYFQVFHQENLTDAPRRLVCNVATLADAREAIRCEISKARCPAAYNTAYIDHYQPYAESCAHSSWARICQSDTEIKELQQLRDYCEWWEVENVARLEHHANNWARISLRTLAQYVTERGW